MNPLRAPNRLLGAGLASALLLGPSACAGPAGSASGSDDPHDGPSDGLTATAPPTPSASGLVTAVTTVLQEGDGPPELCLGGVAESFPPQCSGPEIAGWDWGAVEADSAQDTTWGVYTVEGTWDGETFHLTDVTGPTEPPTTPPDARLDPDNAGAVGRDMPEPEAQELQDEVFDDLDGLTGWTENGYVWVTVVYDDGSIQRYADDRYGGDTVAVQSALQDVG
ncbi:hypothetical protein [Promicromonospora iranensis]|uniref:Peptidase YpeB-like protein n=1 Tax=Promicromonospora iranensis TaxID=1105144 RepID=A0ABU2CKY8_9MICO|nr:hypothetical protein [Promicromonospora iranensis]MDR7381998.1 hypothetical protein [Promicromonospora iranensis]